LRKKRTGDTVTVAKFNMFTLLRPGLFTHMNWMRVLFFALTSSVLATAEDPSSSREDEINWAKERRFWAFQMPAAPARPVVKNKRWPTQPLDYFILARLEQKNLTPSLEADKRTLIRRATFDLTGLPPTPEELESFLADRRADAYVRLVDRLLGSPRFGEHLASLWLPLARYGEDQAHQVGSDTKFFYPNAYKYREWVINAFNHDLPYDQFLKFQLAADRMDPAPDNLAALGFIGLGPKYYNRGRIEVMADEWEDRVDTVTRTTLGLTVACARCHDHKFDPITTRDYYALAGVFASTKMVNRTAEGKEDKGEKAEKMDPSMVHIVEDGTATNLNVFVRGNAERQGPAVERRFLRILSDQPPAAFQDGSGRKELAEAIACRNNPLTARVMVNRLWGQFLARPLVPTPSNFGHSGQPPTCPELLDDLAVRFMDNGWSMKKLVREIVLSATYRQGSAHPSSAAVLRPSSEPPELSRMNRRRLSVEQWRDAVLFVAGTLKWEGGKSLELDDPANDRRTVYARVSRLKLNDVLTQFDYPDANVHAEKRAVTITPTQKLFMLNSPFILAQARALAARLSAQTPSDDPARVRQAYRLLFAREPQRTELELGLEFLRKPGAPELSRWDQYAQMLLVSNEMMYVD
jgi:hypothetical protein